MVLLVAVCSHRWSMYLLPGVQEHPQALQPVYPNPSIFCRQDRLIFAVPTPCTLTLSGAAGV